VRFGIVLTFCASLLLAACSHGGPAPTLTGERFAASADPTESYKLGVGDKVRVTVFNEPSLSGEFSVGADGKMSLPLVGDVTAQDKTPPQLAVIVQGLMANGYLRDPKVSAEVITYRPFFILGEVKAPGQYPYVSGLTVMNAIATAQGFTPRAQRRTVYIRRSGAAAEEAFHLSPDLRVWPGDTIRLGERYF
jgi:polysaccharide export outer membrane protein